MSGLGAFRANHGERRRSRNSSGSAAERQSIGYGLLDGWPRGHREGIAPGDGLADQPVAAVPERATKAGRACGAI